MPKDRSPSPRRVLPHLRIPSRRQVRVSLESPTVNEKLENNGSPRRIFNVIRQSRGGDESSPCDPWTAKSETSPGFAVDALRAFSLLQLSESGAEFEPSETKEYGDESAFTRSSSEVFNEKDTECNNVGEHSETATLAVSEGNQSDDDLTAAGEFKDNSIKGLKESLFDLSPAPTIVESDPPTAYSDCDDLEAQVTTAQPFQARKYFHWTKKEWANISSVFISFLLLCFAAYKLKK